MKTAKQTLIVCWIITIISFLGIIYFHSGLHVYIDELLTGKDLVCNEDECSFYQGIFSNIFTGSVVSIFMTYVSYGRAKHTLEFQLKASEQTMAMYFNTMTIKLYHEVNLSHPSFRDNNYAAIRRFESDIADIKLCYDRMIEASNDYAPFFMNKKSRNLTNAKRFLQELWVDICPVEDSLLIYTEEKDIKKAIDTTRQKVVAKKDELKNVADSINNY